MIGLIFGDTDFPKEILKKIKRKKTLLNKLGMYLKKFLNDMELHRLIRIKDEKFTR